MTSQAFGQTSTIGDTAAGRVALGTCIFMASDALIAVNKFLMLLLASF